MQSKNISTPIYVDCYKLYQSKVFFHEELVFLVWPSGLDIQLEQEEKNNPVHKKISCRWRNKSHIQFFSCNRYEPTA